MKKLYTMPQNKKMKKQIFTAMDISGPFEMADLRKSKISNNENVSRDISQINQ
jgi:hypothetical protein